MKEAVIDTEENFARIFEACEKGGHWQIASISNARVVPGAARITMLPNSAFTDGVKTTKEEWIAAFRKAVTQSKGDI